MGPHARENFLAPKYHQDDDGDGISVQGSTRPCSFIRRSKNESSRNSKKVFLFINESISATVAVVLVTELEEYLSSVEQCFTKLRIKQEKCLHVSFKIKKNRIVERKWYAVTMLKEEVQSLSYESS